MNNFIFESYELDEEIRKKLNLKKLMFSRINCGPSWSLVTKDHHLDPSEEYRSNRLLVIHRNSIHHQLKISVLDSNFRVNFFSQFLDF